MLNMIMLLTMELFAMLEQTEMLQTFALLKLIGQSIRGKEKILFYFSFYHFYHLGKLDRFNS